MARWSESRGYTLVLTHPRGPDRYARVELVNKRTLFGLAYNVREARAEDASRSGRAPEALGLGRMLSWRWLGEREAEELLSARLGTLETLGYSVLGGDQPEASDERGPWDWLRELVHRQLERSDGAAAAEARSGAAAAGGGGPDAAASLRESLDRLGLEPDAVIEGMASILEIDEATLREPDPASARTHELEMLEKLAILLPVWLEHDAPQLREIGARWLALPTMPYEIDRAVLERWAGGAGALAEALAPRLAREGLALLGPEALVRLSHTAKQPEIQELAGRWRDRLRPASGRVPG